MKCYRLFFLIGFVFLIFFFSVYSALAQDAIRKDDYAGDNEDGHNLYIEEETPVINDPWENYNRVIFKFNHTIYNYILDPLSQGYNFLMPRKVQGRLDNLFSNIAMPVRLFNNLFQGKFAAASAEMGRFLINSTLGLAGLFDPARSIFDLELQEEDFGQTLGYYKMGPGSYIVWPVLGPSNVRDSIGSMVDLAFSPLTWFSILDLEPDQVFSGMNALKWVNNYSYNLRDDYEDLIKQSFDHYISIQHAYTQNRQKKIKE